MMVRETLMTLREYALSLPGAYEDFPWSESVIKVNKKIFLFLGDSTDDKAVNFWLKLPISNGDALNLPFTRPTGYNLGKSGWISVHFPADEDPPVDLFISWVEESYCAIASKKLLAQMGTNKRPFDKE